MSIKTFISLADLAACFAELKPDDAEARLRIAEVLGFTGAPADQEPPLPGEQESPRPITRSAEGGTPSPFDALTPPATPETPAAGLPTRATLSFDLAGPFPGKGPPGDGPKPEWWNRVRVIDSHARPARIPEPAPLLLPMWSRTTYMRALSTPVPEGRIDLDRLIHMVAQKQIPARIPRLPWPTMRHGLQVLLDYGNAMMPFRQDQRAVLRDVWTLAGSGAFFEVFAFRDSPVRWTQSLLTARTLRGYELPPTGAAILAVADLGMAALAAGQSYVPPEEWLAFAREAAQAGCPVVVLTPYHPDRYPSVVRSELRLVHWHHARGTVRPNAPPLGAGTGEAWQLVEDLRRANPQAAALAHIASLASRIERSLLRELRQAHLPEADGGAEADLWFSPLASMRSESALLLQPHVAGELRQNLFRSDPELFNAAWGTLQAYRERTGAFQGTRIEEEITYWLAQGGPAAGARVQELLRQAVKTVYERGNEDTEGLALWSVELLDSLSPEARQSDAGQDLGVAAGFRLHPSHVPKDALPDDIGGRQWLIPVNVAGLPEATLWVGREEAGLVLADQEGVIPGAKKLAGLPAADGTPAVPGVPATTPILLWLSWNGRREKVAVQPGQKAGPLPTGDLPVTIETFTGTRWELTPSLSQTRVEGPEEEPAQEDTALDFAGQGLTELPAAVFENPKLKRLNLSRNRLAVLPARVGELADLEELIVDENELEGLPDEVGKLTNLRVLSAARNRWQSIPDPVRGLKQLERLDLAGNQLESLPSWLRELERLAQLDLRDNPFTQYDEGVAYAVRDLLTGRESILNTLEVVSAPSEGVSPGDTVLIYTSGVNGETGEYLEPPVPAADMARRILEEGPDPVIVEARGRSGPAQSAA